MMLPFVFYLTFSFIFEVVTCATQPVGSKILITAKCNGGECSFQGNKLYVDVGMALEIICTCYSCNSPKLTWFYVNKYQVSSSNKSDKNPYILKMDAHEIDHNTKLLCTQDDTLHTRKTIQILVGKTGRPANTTNIITRRAGEPLKFGCNDAGAMIYSSRPFSDPLTEADDGVVVYCIEFSQDFHDYIAKRNIYKFTLSVQKTESSQMVIILYGGVLLASILLIIPIIYYFVMKKSRNNSHEENYAVPHVVYAELKLTRTSEESPVLNESPYAEVVGVWIPERNAFCKI